MMSSRSIASLIACISIALATSAAAQSSVVPRSAFYAAIGGGYAWTHFGTQHLFAIGVSDVYLNSTGELIANGTAAGPGDVPMPNKSTFAPSANVGFFQHFPGSDWLWGVRFSYTYVRATSTVDNVKLPQAGAYTEAGVVYPFIGHADVQSYATSFDHQIALMPFIGKSFDRWMLYAGGGVTYSRTRTNVNQLVGFANITLPDGQHFPHADISGPPQDFAGAGWVWGGGAMVGGTYFFDSSWFVDLAYTYARTKNQTFNYASSFTNPNGPNDTTTIGSLIGNSSGRVEAQTVLVTIGKTF
jgi:opacity protein-like surface antigen